MRQLCKQSGHSASKIRRVICYWLNHTPHNEIDYSSIKYVVYDATYFHKDGCLLNLMDATDQRIIAHLYVQKESFKDAYPWFIALKEQGFNPKIFTTDGEQSVMRAMRLIWPNVELQRCLYHLQHEGMRWLRTYPKTEAGKELRHILSTLSGVRTVHHRDAFLQAYSNWLDKYKGFVMALPRTTIAFKDLQRTMRLINNALPDMFRYLSHPNIPSTTNSLEGFHSRLKSDYQRHRGLTKQHRINYIAWYCYYENRSN